VSESTPLARVRAVCLALPEAAPEGMQQALVHGEPEHYFVPPYVGHLGRYRLSAPKRLGRFVGSRMTIGISRSVRSW
jgi:hypothetical protein